MKNNDTFSNRRQIDAKMIDFRIFLTWILCAFISPLFTFPIFLIHFLLLKIDILNSVLLSVIFIVAFLPFFTIFFINMGYNMFLNFKIKRITIRYIFFALFLVFIILSTSFGFFYGFSQFSQFQEQSIKVLLLYLISITDTFYWGSFISLVIVLYKFTKPN